MLLNRAFETVRNLRQRTRRLRERALRTPRRTPLVLVPSILGTRLADRSGRVLWGDLRRLYWGPSLSRAPEVRPDGLLEGIPILPKVLAYDVFGGLIRFLEQVGGYRRGVDLHALTYDWRLGIPDAAERLEELLDQLCRIHHPRVDLLCVSTGGLVARYCLAGAPPKRVRRAVYIGTPHRGAFSTLFYLSKGLCFAPWGKVFDRCELGALQTVWDALPHPDERVFVGEDGQSVDVDLYDPESWNRLGLDPPVADFAERLRRAARVHRVLDGSRGGEDSVVIGARNLQTLARCAVKNGRLMMPACEPQRGEPLAPLLYEPGDSSVCESSLRALRGLDPGRVWFVSVPEHRTLPAMPQVHHLALEALIAGDGRRAASLRRAGA